MDENVSRKRSLADFLYKGKDGQGFEGEYDIEFCVEAVEMSRENLVEARAYLQVR